MKKIFKTLILTTMMTGMCLPAFAIKNMITQSIYVAIGVFIMMVLTKGFKLKMINYRSSMAVYILSLIHI